MLFTLKKIIGGLLLPLPFLLLLILSGIFILWFTRWQKSGKTLVSAGGILLALLSLQPVADRLLLPLEQRYPVWKNQQTVHYIVVLGGGYTWNEEWAPSSNLFNNSLPRLTEALRVWRNNPEAKLIFTGGKATSNPVSSAEVAARVAQSLGVPTESIITLSTPKDTSQEAAAVAAIVGQSPFALVTSASHMPRAMVFFLNHGLHPFPAPANQLAISSPLNPWERLLPSPLWLMHSDRAIYERLGGIWQQLTLKPSTLVQPREE
ncbi:MAG: hypothetical protein XXXJIFNMEKO3_00980 [Candidatus Erwinia impunctatus]|nr:hypothetical protein XXXJIFNMEKO_00980 [Culicoides impunctatus]